MELDKIADGLTKSAAASRTLGPIVKPGQYAAWAGDLKKVAEDHYSKLQAEKTAAPTTDQPTGEGGNFLTNTFNTLKENYNNLDPALQNTIAGAGIGLGGGALAGLGSNLFSGRKKKNYLGDMMSMGLLGGLGGAGAGGLYSLATDPGVIERGAKAMGFTPTQATQPPAPADPKEDPNTPQGRANLLDKRLNATGIDAYTTDKAKNDLQTAGYMAGAGAATGVATKGLASARGLDDPTRVTPNNRALQEQASKNNLVVKNTPIAPSASEIKAVTITPAAAQAEFGYTINPTTGKPKILVGSKLLTLTNNNLNQASAMANILNGTDVKAKEQLAKTLLTKNTSVSYEPSVKEMSNILGKGSAADIQKHFGYVAGKDGKITLNPNSPLMRAVNQNAVVAKDLARQLETGPLAQRQALAQKLLNPGFVKTLLGSNRISLGDSALKTDAQKAFRQANPVVQPTDTHTEAFGKRLRGAISKTKGMARSGLGLGGIGALAGLGNLGFQAYTAETNDADRGKILSEQISNLLGSNTVTNPAQLQSLQGMANAAAQGLTPAQADYINKELTKIYQAP